jgi:hypothetical protein
MDTKKNINEDVEGALLLLHKRIDFLKAQVEKLCETTGKCKPLLPPASKKETK